MHQPGDTLGQAGTNETENHYTTDILRDSLPTTAGVHALGERADGGRPDHQSGRPDPLSGGAVQATGGDHSNGAGNTDGQQEVQRGRAAKFEAIDTLPGTYIRLTELVKEST